MPMNEDERRRIGANLDACDNSLANCPVLASVFHEEWRAIYRRRMLELDSCAQFEVPLAYGVPLYESKSQTIFPLGCQARLEEGAKMFREGAISREWEHLVGRLRDDVNLSAIEELLLLRGFHHIFGGPAIRFNSSHEGRQPEFTVIEHDVQMEVEAKGLDDPVQIRELNRLALKCGGQYYVTAPVPGSLHRVKRDLCEKTTGRPAHKAFFLCYTQYTPWLNDIDAAACLAECVKKPSENGVPDSTHLLGIAYITFNRVRGIWLSAKCRAGLSVGDDCANRIRRAVEESFWPREDERFDWEPAI